MHIKAEIEFSAAVKNVFKDIVNVLVFTTVICQSRLQNEAISVNIHPTRAEMMPERKERMQQSPSLQNIDILGAVYPVISRLQTATVL